MKISHVAAMVKRDILINIRMKWRLMEFIYFPLLTVLTWGFFSIYMQDYALQAGLVVLAVNIFYSFAHLAQSTTNSQMMEDVWSGSLKQVLVSGITEGEYIVSRVISTTIAAVLILGLMFGVGSFFGLTVIFQHGGLFALLALITLLSSIALSIIIVSMILMLGRSYGFLSYSILSLLFLLSAPFYPIDIFPPVMQVVAQAMPYTNVFSGIRSVIGAGTVADGILINGFIVAFAYIIVSIPLYYYAFSKARKTGQLVRMT